MLHRTVELMADLWDAFTFGVTRLIVRLLRLDPYRDL